MSKVITRTFIRTVFEWGEVFKDTDGNLCLTEEEHVELNGDVSEDGALKYLRKTHGRTKNYFIKSLEHKSELRAMDVDDFYANSYVMEDK